MSAVDTGFALGDPILQSLDRIFNVLDQINKRIAQSFKTLEESLGGTKSPEKGKGGMGKKMGMMIKPLMKMFAKVLAPIMIIGALLKGIFEPFQLLLEPLEVIGDLIGMTLYPILEPILERMWEMVDAFADFIEESGPIMEIVGEIIEILIDLFMNVIWGRIQFIWGKIQALFNFIMNMWQSIFDLLSGKINLFEFFAEIMGHFGQLITELIQNIIRYVRTIWDAIMEALGEFGIEIVDWFKDLPNQVMGGAQDWWAGATEDAFWRR